MDTNKDENKKTDILLDPLEQEAEAICRWAAARAGVIVIIPLAGTLALVANEFYLIQRLAKLYGDTVSEKMICSFIGGLGGAFAGQTLATLIPFAPMQIPIGMAVTYGVGKAAQAWIKQGMKPSGEKYQNVFKAAKKDGNVLVPILKESSLKDIPLGNESKKFTL